MPTTIENTSTWEQSDVVALSSDSSNTTSTSVVGRALAREVPRVDTLGLLKEWFLQRIGTGGTLTLHVNGRIEPGTASVPTIRWPEVRSPRGPLPSPEEMLAVSMANFSLSVTDVSRLIGVERPTVYAWLRDESNPQDHNYERIVRLFTLAKRWESEASATLRDWARERQVSKRSVLQQVNGWVNGATDSIPALVRTHPVREQSTFSAYDRARARGLQSNEETRERLDRITGKRRDIDSDAG
jgi:hypothetical protein